MSINVKIKAFNSNTVFLIAIGETIDSLQSTTVAQLLLKVNQIESLRIALKNSKLKFDEQVLEDDNYLSYYNIKENSLIEIAKHFDRDQHFGIKFVYKPDAITGDDSILYLRAELSCGHAVDPNSLTGWCRSLIDDGKFEFYCPAIIENRKKCEKKWEYAEVRRLALLNESEMENFETKLSQNAAQLLVDYKECPKCRSFVERIDLTDLRVKCSICQYNKNDFEFCWQCEIEWPVDVGNAAYTCGRANCKNKGLQVLAECKMIKLASCPNLAELPSIRACPTCGNLVEHDGTACKNMFCKRCDSEFCFACLQTTANCQKLKPSSHFTTCANLIAPIQTSIPLWMNRLSNV